MPKTSEHDQIVSQYEPKIYTNTARVHKSAGTENLDVRLASSAPHAIAMNTPYHRLPRVDDRSDGLKPSRFDSDNGKRMSRQARMDCNPTAAHMIASIVADGYNLKFFDFRPRMLN